MLMSIYSVLQAALLSTDIEEKCHLTLAAAQCCAKVLPGQLDRSGDARPMDFSEAGHPEKPLLVAPAKLKQRKINTAAGYAALLHSICHIEFNAINLALDAAYRFRCLPEQFTRDWVRVAAEEAQHFMLMHERLKSFDFKYGDFPAHDHLWASAYKTAFDPLLRMALVPRILEARGLDVTPNIRAKVEQCGDLATCAVLDTIYREEMGHVYIGNYWYQYLCRQRGLEPIGLFRRLLSRYDLFIFRGYVNMAAREQAGFSAFELAMLENFDQSRQQGRRHWHFALQH